MANITEQVFVSPFAGGAGRDVGLELRNEELIRPLSFGDNWTKLRIAVLMGLGQTALNGVGNVLPAALVDIGVCSGTERGIGSANPVNYMGVGYGGGWTARYGPDAAGVGRLRGIEFGTVNGWTTSGSLNGNYSHFRTAQHGSTVDGYSQSRSDSAGAVYFYGPNSTLNNGAYRRGMLVADFHRKSSVLFASYLYYSNASPQQCDFTTLNLLDACDGVFGASFDTSVYNFNSTAMVALSYVNQLWSNTLNLAYAGSAGPLDSVNISWNQSVCTLTVWGVTVARYA